MADYAAHFRRALNSAAVEVFTPLLGQRPLTSLAAARAWVAERDWSRIDVVHAELGDGRHSEFFALCALAALPQRPALSATIHDPERLVWRPVNRLWRAVEKMHFVPRPLRQVLALLCDPHTLWAERRLARQLEGLATFTDTGATRLVARMRIPSSKVSVIPHGTSHIAAVPLPLRPPLRLVYVGFISQGKGIEDLVDALAQVCEQHPEHRDQVRLSLAGGMAPDATFGTQARYLDALRARVKERGLEDQVDWELDVDARDLPALIQRHHVVVLPCRESRALGWRGQMRGTSGALTWATACGRGVITSNARAFAEEIQSGNGESYPQGHVPSLAARLEGLLTEPERAQAWAAQATQLAAQRQWPAIGGRFRAHFEAVLQRHGVPLRAASRRPVVPPSAPTQGSV